MPVENTPHEGRNQIHARLGAGSRLGKRKQQRQITIDPCFFQLFSGTDTLPGRGQLDQNTFAANTGIVIEFDKALGLGNAGLGIVRKAGVHFGRNAAGHQLQNFHADIDRQPVGGVGHLCRPIVTLAARPGNGVIDIAAVFRDLGGVENQRRVSGRILRLIAFDGGDIAGIGYDGGHFTQGTEFVCHNHVLMLSRALRNRAWPRRNDSTGGRSEKRPDADFYLSHLSMKL